ncbi:DUF1778 domain-containing protein [Echinicola marina]|uniref:type II toxin-antitoxin system TacA family antitoxin n=1 Tax=Echinicola marina TaxID=2859768 RepID=UPI001CF62E9E|nr:DUF1778 domain-containing protein [Echinicola marina]UCS95421.1 DUF1778 domain-containing protein [Echinicola marina]
MKVMEIVKKSRFEMRISDDDKSLIERASKIKGYSSLAGFVSEAAKKEASLIIEEHDRILASELDKKTFFNAILSDLEPNSRLKEAIKRYKEKQ